MVGGIHDAVAGQVTPDAPVAKELEHSEGFLGVFVAGLGGDDGDNERHRLFFISQIDRGVGTSVDGSGVNDVVECHAFCLTGEKELAVAVFDGRLLALHVGFGNFGEDDGIGVNGIWIGIWIRIDGCRRYIAAVG